MAVNLRRDALKRELHDAEKLLSIARDEATRAHLGEIRDRLAAIDAILRQQADLAKSRPHTADTKSEIDAGASPSVLALNDLYEAREKAEQHHAWLEERLEASRAALASARDKHANAERERRAARVELEAADHAAAKTKAERTLALRQLASRAAQERVHLRTLETRHAADALAAVEDGRDYGERIAEMRAAIQRGEETRGHVLASLAEREGALRRDRRAAERTLSTLELRLQAAQQRFAQQARPSQDLLDEVDAVTSSRDAVRLEISLIDAQLERLETQGITWQRWQALLRGEGSREDLDAWRQELEEQIESRVQTEIQRKGQRADLERRLEGLQARLASMVEGERARSALEKQRTRLAQALAVAHAETSDLEADRRIRARVLAEIHDRTGGIDPFHYLARAIQAVRSVWAYEITTVDDDPITVGSLALALLFFGIGLRAARHGSEFVERFATQRFGLDPGAAHALQTLAFYALLVGFTLLALRVVHFPLTAFTVLGGALAIGIGFGSQNVMNNFISGLILMLERPVRARDVVEVDGNHGTIERIGARSTQIRSTDGRHIVVPNSFFLESNVVNWTLSDDLIRVKVTVGVIYGSPTRLVEQLIRKVVDENDLILKRPEPIIIFEEFGDNSLNFDVYFWVKARSPMEARKVQSGVRFCIDDLFREHGLVIAFPQRDVHLDSTSPLEVRVVEGSGALPRVTDE